MKRMLTVILGTLLLTFSCASTAYAQVKIQWFGQACFLITSPAGVKILVDPFGPDLGYPMPDVTPDVVLVTHEHFDHNYVQMAKGNPQAFHGLNSNGDWNTIDTKIKDVRIYSVAAWHFEKEKDASRGKDTVMVMEFPGLRLVHVGDIGRAFTKTQLDNLGKVDVLMVPVGSVYTIDAAGADKVIGQINPKLVFPMHYKTAALKIQLDKIDAFLAGKNNVRKISGNTYLIDKLPDKQKIIVLDYK